MIEEKVNCRCEGEQSQARTSRRVQSEQDSELGRVRRGGRGEEEQRESILDTQNLSVAMRWWSPVHNEDVRPLFRKCKEC